MKDTASGPKCRLNSRFSPAWRDLNILPLLRREKKEGHSLPNLEPRLVRNNFVPCLADGGTYWSVFILIRAQRV